ncbi:MAG: peptide chain release factor N(5)-glutamine methyltransferase [Candidatus Coatesbacteria bacterium]|nr:peptide chain release factor N(5)-glutamine methyltransferase [Candidatus Coatesbacteria bacterium]
MITGEVIRQVTKLFANAGLQNPGLDAELIVAHCLGIEPSVLALKSRESPSEEQVCEVRKLATRRAEREPIQYILGHWEFWSIDLVVREGVLIPRPETETLVEAAIELVSARSQPDAAAFSPLVLDIGTGSGAIAIAIAKELGKRCRVIATDISSSALVVAMTNVRRSDMADVVKLVQCDMAEALSADSLARKVDLIICNPPYIPTRLLKELQPEICRFEPTIALDGGASGLDFYPRLMEMASALLATGGALVCEIAPDMPDDIGGIWQAFHRFLGKPDFAADLTGRPRAAILRRLP